MGNVKKNNQDVYVVDILHVMKTLWRKVWIIVIAGLLVAAIGFAVSAFVIPPLYTSSVMLYVNNSSISLGGASFEISSSQITAARSLVETYTIILTSRTTLERVIAEENLPYTYEDMLDMIKASAVNETEVMQVSVTTKDPDEAARIANRISIVLPLEIERIIDGAQMVPVDSAVPDYKKVSPSISQYTAIGLIVGVLISVMAITIGAIMDNTIHDDDYIMRTYEYPILAKIPDLVGGSGKKGYGYYYRRYYKTYRTYETPEMNDNKDKNDKAGENK